MMDTTQLRRKLLDLAISGKLVPKQGEWKMVRLGTVCDILTGNVFDSKGFVSSGVKICGGLIIDPKGIKWNECKYWPSAKGLEDFLLKGNDVVVALDRPWISSGAKVGLIQTEDLPCLLIQRTARLRSEEVDPLWLMALLTGNNFRTHCVPTGSVLPHISHKDISTFVIPLPPLAEQKAIVKRLEELLSLEREIAADSAALDDLISAAKRKILDLAISGKLVPKQGEWTTAKLSDLCETFADGDWIESKDQSESGIRLVQTGNIGEMEFLSKESRAKFISWETFDRLNCTEVIPGDVLVSRLPEPVGRACIVPDIGMKMITAVDCTIVRPKDVLLPQFLIYFTASPQYLGQVKQNLAGTTRKRISRGNLAKIEVPLPSLAEQTAIVRKVEELFAVLDAMKGPA